MTGHLRIGGALLLGLAIIFVAFIMARDSVDTAAKNTGTLEVSTARSYIEPIDADADGTPDWEEDFTAQIFDSIEVPTSTVTSVGYVAPTTFTGKFSEAFFKDYMEAKMAGTDLSDPTDLINNAVSAIEANTTFKEYTPLDIVSVADTDQAIRDYGNDITRIIQTHSLQNTNEAVILHRALEEGDPELLAELGPIEDVYSKFIEETLRVETPQSFRDEHLALLNAYEAIRTDIKAMRVAFIDPLYSLARIRQYQNDATMLGRAIQGISSELKTRGVVYSADEPGALFYMLGL